MAMELATSLDRVQKFVEEIEAEKTILSTCTLLFTTLSNHYKSLEESLSLRSNSVESRLQSLETASRQTLESLSLREDSIPQRESEAVDRVRERKQAAIAEIEKPVSGDAGFSEILRSLALRMDCFGLVKLIISKRKETMAIRAELVGAISEAIDPPTLVLNAVEEFLNNKASKPSTMDNRWALGMLISALFPNMNLVSTSNSEEKNVYVGPTFARCVVERAFRLLEKWRGQMVIKEDGIDFGKFGQMEAVMFLQLVIGFGLTSRFDEEFLEKMVVEFSSRRDMAKLAPLLGFGDKLTDIIDELVKMGKEIDAVYFATESGMTEKFSPVSLLKSYLKNSKKNATDALNKGSNSAAASESSNIELNAIKAVVKCVEDQKLESVFKVDVLKKRANVLEKSKAERKKTLSSAPSSSKPSNKRSNNSGSGKGSGQPLRPAKVAKTSYHPPHSRRAPAQIPRQPSPAARFSVPQYSYSPRVDAYGVGRGNLYSPSSYSGDHGRSVGVSRQQYSPIMDNSVPAASSGQAYFPTASAPRQQYSPIMDNSVTAASSGQAYFPTASSGAGYLQAFLGERAGYTGYDGYDYSSAGQQAYHPSNPSYTH